MDEAKYKKNAYVLSLMVFLHQYISLLGVRIKEHTLFVLAKTLMGKFLLKQGKAICPLAPTCYFFVLALFS